MLNINSSRVRLIAAGSLMSLALVLGACAPADPGNGTTLGTSLPAGTSAPTLTDDETTAGTGDLELTLDELAQYNGKDGQPAYVAVDGVIYDVTDLDAWADGEHQGLEAGKDLTEEFAESPHDDTTMDAAEVVGRLVEP